MASVVKRKNSKFWTACYTARDGRQLKRSTKTTDKRQAERIAMEFEDVERKAKHGDITTAQVRKVLNEVTEKINGDTIIPDSTEKYLNDWVDIVRKRSAAPATIERYNHSVELFLASLGDKAKKPITAVTPRDIEVFLNSRVEAGVAPKTQIVDLKTINIVFRRAHIHNIIPFNPVAAVRPPREVCSERDVFTPEEVQKLFEAAPGVEWQTLILLGYFVGARLSDCARMTWENVNLEKETIDYVQQKTGTKVSVPLHDNLVEQLHFISAFTKAGFLTPKLANKLTSGRRGLSESFKRIVIKAGLDPMTSKGKGIRNFSKRSFHSLRHSFNSFLANAGVPEEVRRALTGHQSQEMNAKYTHLKTETLKDAVNKLPLLGPAKPGSVASDGKTI